MNGRSFTFYKLNAVGISRDKDLYHEWKSFPQKDCCDKIFLINIA